VHKIGPKDTGNRNFVTLGFLGEPVGATQILRSMATARDKQKFVFLGIKGPKT
jgi:hypothetical protein